MTPQAASAEEEADARPWEGPRPTRAFVVLGGTAALLFTALTPPLGNPDEHTHLARAYLVSEGHLAVPGRAPHAHATVPRSLLTLHRRLAHTNFRRPPRRIGTPKGFLGPRDPPL